MPTDAVLFDVAGTLAVPEDRDAWLAGATAALDLVVGEPPALAAELERVGRPGGPYPATVPELVRAAYEARDSGPDAHRAGYVGLLESAALPEPRLGAALSERIRGPAGGVASPDAGPTLRALRERAIRPAAVSNLGCDLRPVLAG